MMCSETILFQGAEIICDREQGHPAAHRSLLRGHRECDQAETAFSVEWDVTPCLVHPTPPHLSAAFIEDLKERMREGEKA